MFHFCELDAAARMRPRAASVGPPAAFPSGQLDGSNSASQLGSPRGSLGAPVAGAAAGGGSSTQLSPMHSYAPSWSGSEASDLFPGSSTSSLAASAAAAAAAPGGGSSPADSPAQHPQQPHHHHERTPPRTRPQHAQHAQQPHGSARSSSPAHSSRQQLVAPGGLLPGSAALATPALASPGAGAALGGSGQLRLALPVQQRGAAKAAARLLREQLATAQADLQGEQLVASVCALPQCSLLVAASFVCHSPSLTGV